MYFNNVKYSDGSNMLCICPSKNNIISNKVISIVHPKNVKQKRRNLDLLFLINGIVLDIDLLLNIAHEIKKYTQAHKS